MERGKPIVDEVLPSPDFANDSAALFDLPEPTRARVTIDAPVPRVSLDPVASLLWKLRSRHNLAFVVRALAVWWWLAEEPDGMAGDSGMDMTNIVPEVVAEAVVAAVSSHARKHSTVNAFAAASPGVSRRTRRGGAAGKSGRAQRLQPVIFSEEEEDLDQLAILASAAPALAWDI